jgi:hypothetical protein
VAATLWNKVHWMSTQLDATAPTTHCLLSSTRTNL